MLSISEKNQYRSELFRHLDAICIAPVAFALKEKEVSVSQICDSFNANEGYLNVGLRLLASQGWLDHDVDNTLDRVSISTNAKSETVFNLIDRYKDITALLKVSEEFHPRHFEEGQFSSINKIFNKYKNGDFNAISEDKKEQEIEAQIKAHIEGALVGPITVFLGMDGIFINTLWKPLLAQMSFMKTPLISVKY